MKSAIVIMMVHYMQCRDRRKERAKKRRSKEGKVGGYI